MAPIPSTMFGTKTASNGKSSWARRRGRKPWRPVLFGLSGYHADEDYFLPEVRVTGLPARVHRGQKLIEAGGVMRNVRLKREQGEKKVDIWSWRNNPFVGTRELDGLRVMMAVINNWDLKDENNAIRDEKRKDDGDKRVYEVSDLGASFGTTGRGLSHTKSKGNLRSYTRSKFIKKERPEFVDFNVPSRPALVVLFNPHEFFSRMGLRWIGRDIPRQNARWIGDHAGPAFPGSNTRCVSFRRL